MICNTYLKQEKKTTIRISLLFVLIFQSVSKRQVGSIEMQPATNYVIEVNLPALLMLLYKLLWLCTKYSQAFRDICADFISWIHDNTKFNSHQLLS